MTTFRFMTTGRCGGGRPVSRRHIRAVRKGFTLVETLAVLAILAVVVSVALPAVASLNKNSQRRAAVTLVLSTIEQARAMALSRNTTCYLVLADANANWPDSLRHRSFAIFEEVYNPTSTRYDLLPLSGWTTLPDGYSFLPEIDTIFSADAQLLPMNFYCLPAKRELPGAYFKFNSLGGLDEPTRSRNARLRIFPGTVNAGGGVRRTDNRGTAGDEEIRLSLTTGRARRVEFDPRATPEPL